MGRDRKCEGFTKRGLCGHSGAGRRGGLVPMADSQGVELRNGDLKSRQWNYYMIHSFIDPIFKGLYV